MLFFIVFVILFSLIRGQLGLNYVDFDWEVVEVCLGEDILQDKKGLFYLKNLRML